MNKNTQKMTWIYNTWYKKTVEEELKSLDAIKAFRSLFKKNQGQIKKSMKKSLENHAFNVNQLTLKTNNEIEHHRYTYEATLGEINENAKKTEKTYEETIETLKKNLEEKNELSNLKKQKIHGDYEFSVKKAMENMLKIQNQADNAIDEAVETHSARLSDLERDTNIRYHINDNNKEQKRLNFNMAYEAIKKRFEIALKEAEDSLENAKADFKETLEERQSIVKESNEDQGLNTDDFKTLKLGKIAHINDALKTIEDIKIQEKISIDEQNTQYNKATLEYEQTRQAIRIDHDMQMSNFEHSRDEVEHVKTHEKTKAQPETDLLENEAASLKAKEEAKLKRNMDASKASNELEKALKTIERALDVKSFERQRSEAKHIRDHAFKDAEIKGQLATFEKDYVHETMISDHHLKENENYVALKSELISARKPLMDQEHQDRLMRSANRVETMIEEAKKDYDTMVKAIDHTYEEETKIYKSTYETLKKNHKKILENITSEQMLRKNKTLEEINKLRNFKDKKKKQQLRQKLNQQTQKDEKDYLQKKHELEKKENVHKNMLESIKRKRDKALDEAQSLLYQTTSSLKAYATTLRKMLEREKEAFSEIEESIKNQGRLFKAFQGEQKQATLEDAKNYLNTRIHRAKSEKTANDALKTKYLKNLKEDLERSKKKNETDIDSAQRTYEQRIETIDKTLEDTLDAINHDKKTEEKRLNLYITKLNRTHETKMQELRKRLEEEKTNLFEEKDESEKRLMAEKERLTNAFEQDKENYEAALQKTIDSLDELMREINALIDEDPLNHVTSHDVHTLVEALKGQVSTERLK